MLYELATTLKRLWTEPVGRWTVLMAFIVLFPLYAVTLPASLTGGHIGWDSLRLLAPGQAVFAFCLAVLLALTLATMVLLIRHGQRASKSTGIGGALVAFFAPLLCCSPLIPLGLGALAVVFPAVAGFAPGIIQGFIATHEFEIELFAVALSFIAFWQNARKLARGPVCATPHT
ncbi:hypothetical protein [Acidihalobacter prosperus]|nr:hypothetical protein [Acidihalobacter prosperus]